MQKHAELDWVAQMLRDVVTFLVENGMMQSAQTLAAAAAHIEHDMKREKPATENVATELNVIGFPIARRQLH